MRKQERLSDSEKVDITPQSVPSESILIFLSFLCLLLNKPYMCVCSICSVDFLFYLFWQYAAIRDTFICRPRSLVADACVTLTRTLSNNSVDDIIAQPRTHV